MKNALVGRSGFVFTLARHFREPGTLKHLFFEYIDMSSIGLLFVGQVMRGWSWIFFQIVCVTKDPMHPLALCSRVMSVYRCQLLYHSCPPFGEGRLHLHLEKAHGLGREEEMAFSNIPSLSSVVGSSAGVAEYHSMSKCRRDVSDCLPCECLIQ